MAVTKKIKMQTKSTGAASKAIARIKKTKKKPSGKRETPKGLAKKKGAKKRAPVKTKALGRKAIAGKTLSGLRKRDQVKRQSVDTVALPLEEPAPRSGSQSGDLQGLSSSEGADSESVEELLEEGNALEADAVTGVEEAEASDESEVHTREVLSDDVPDEYLDKD